MNISVIVPVYNTAEYLTKCLDSLVSQSCGNFEVICVNDGSTDASYDILSRYQLEHPQIIRIINQNNAGLSEARNTGLRNSSGEYIAFVDSDDYISPDMIKRLYDKAISGSYDVTVCDVAYEYPNRTVIVSSNIDFDMTDSESIKRSMLSVYPTVWNKLYRRELFEKGVLFRKGIWYEDFEFLYRLYPHISSIGTIKAPLYYYRQRPGAISGTYDKRLFQYITNFDGILKYFKENNLYDEYNNQLEYLYVRYAYATMPRRLARTGNYRFFIDGINFAQKQVKANFPNYRKNSLFKRQGAKGWYLLFFNKLLSRFVYLTERMSSGV